MSLIGYRVIGKWAKTHTFLKKNEHISPRVQRILMAAGEKGCEALREAAPKDSGLLASSWRYSIEIDGGTINLIWHNDDIEGGYNVALLVQYGHGTGTGGYVQSNDYINPAMKSVFDAISEEVWKEVTQ